ncbi:hypothetical protein [Agromyces protaetiae]|uniref:hypothetical protein n=1 Tax=Agromyces protaetiae TaxID=2509455 RepID=UPI0013ECFF82|nr:hypothetical protein [Agromyces protaetiae]
MTSALTERSPVRPNDATLAARPEQFRYRRSMPRTILLGVAAVAAFIALALVLVNFESIRENASDMTGRRSGLKGIVAPGLVLLTAFFGVLFAWLAIAVSHVWERVETGVRLKPMYFTVDGDVAVGNALYERFLTGDPAKYRPIPNHKKGALTVGVYRADADRLAFVTIEIRGGKQVHPWPLITMSDRAYGLIRRLNHGDLVRSPGALDAVLDS